MTTIPTLSALYNEIINDLQTEFGVIISNFGKAWLRGFAATQAKKLKLFYLALGNVQNNTNPITAEPAAVGGTLERWGAVKGLTIRPATQGQYTCTVTGTTGGTIPAGTTFKSDDNSLNPGYLYRLDDAFTLSSSSGSITLRALTAGTESILAVTNTLTATSPIVNVNSTATVTAVFTSPVEAETTEEFRQRILDAYQLSPQGGAPADYVLWASDAAGVRTSYPYAASGVANEINLYVEAILSDSVGPPFKGVPTSTILTDVESVVETDPDTGIGRRPLGVFAINVLPVVPKDLTIQIDSGGTITVAQQALIISALTEAIYDIRPFIAGVDPIATRNDTISTFGIGSVIIETIGGVIISSIDLTVDSSPEVSYMFDNGEIPYIDPTDITFI